MWKRTVWPLALVLGATVLVSLTAVAQETGDEEFLEQVSRAQGIPLEQLEIGARATFNYPLTGVRLSAAKVLDPITGQGYLVAVDAQGRPVDVAVAAAAEEDAKVATSGKLDPRLYARLAELRGHETIPVSIWLNVPDPPLSRPGATAPGVEVAQDPQAALNSRLAAVEQHVVPRRRGVLAALARMGVQARVPQYAPAVFAELNHGQITALARHPDVGTIYGPEAYTLFMDKAATTERAYRVWAAGNLGAGGSSRPVVHEPDGPADFNPFLNNATHPVIFWCTPGEAGCLLGKNIEDHATEVAGVIASTHPLFRGIAPSSQIILSANSQDFSDANLVDAFEWARANGGDPTNMSWGTVCGGFQTFMSRYVDWAIKNLSATFVIAAGNHPADCEDPISDEKVAAPALAWGAIAVGSQADGNTGFWSGDSMSTFSDWRNPDFAPSMEKPEVVAVGQAVRTTDAQGGDHLTPGGVNGTSFAAPQVAGQVVQLLSRRPGQNQWPETNKAAILASAYHDIEAGTARDGVGSVVMNNSDDTYRLGRFINDCGAGCVPLVAGNFPRTYLDAISAVAGQRVRVAIAWDSNSNGSTSDVLGADIDLRVRHPDNSTIVCSSFSVQNAWEMCEFTAPVTGKYDILVNLFSSQAGWPGTFLGTAWSIRSLPDFCTGFVSVPSTGGTFSISTANGSTFFDSYAGWSRDQSGRERVLRLVLSTTKDITVTDTNSTLDLHVLQIPNCAADPLVPTVLANGTNSVVINNAPAGTYWIVVDGLNGAVGTTSVTVGVTGP